MLRKVLPLAALAVLFSASLAQVSAACEVTVLEPRSGAKVNAREYVQGKTDLVNKTIWVVVHPLAVADYWVQRSGSVDSDGRWVLQSAFGEPGKHVGAMFEFKAFGRPSANLREGQVLKGWPEAECSSNLVRATRK